MPAARPRRSSSARARCSCSPATRRRAACSRTAACVLLEHRRTPEPRLADDPSLWTAAVDELLRFEGPAKLMARKATEDRAWCGVEIRARDTVYLVILAANRDPAVFADPDTLRRHA